MSAADLEDVLQERLRAASQNWSIPASLSREYTDPPIAIGLDTNVLKRLRGMDPLVVDRLTQKVKSSGARLVVPGQCMTEFWNRHQTFTEDVLNPVRLSLNATLNKLDEVRGIVTAPETIDQVKSDIEELLKNVVMASPREAMQKTLTFWGALEPYITVPYCDRGRFIRIIEARQRTKHPPGFADEKSKQNAAGDSFVWLDFLVGLLRLLLEKSPSGAPSPDDEVWFVTDDRKSDWWSGNHAHPVLVHEAQAVVGVTLHLLTSSDLVSWARGSK